MPKQVLDNRYITSGDLVKLLQNLFGTGKWEVEVRDFDFRTRFIEAVLN